MTKETKNAIKTAKKPQKRVIGRPFEKGNNANPNGRPKGSVNEVTKFKNAIEAFEKEQGKDIYKFILEKASRYPQVLIAIFKALVPQQTEANINIKQESPYSNLSDQELIEKANELFNIPAETKRKPEARA